MTGRKILCVAVLGLTAALAADTAQAQPHYAQGNGVAGSYGAYTTLGQPNPLVFPWAYGAYGGRGVSYEGYQSNYGGGVLRYPNGGMSTYGPYQYQMPMNWPVGWFNQGIYETGQAGCGCR